MPKIAIVSINQILWQIIDPHRHLQYYLSYYVFITGAMTSIYVCNIVILNTILCCLQLSAMSIMKKMTYNVSFISKVLKNEQPIDGVTLDIFMNQNLHFPTSQIKL